MKELSLTLGFLFITCKSLLMADNSFSMSSGDKAMYTEMLENNPGEMYVDEGGEIFEDSMGGESALAEFLSIKTNELPAFIAGFPRYVEQLKYVAGIDQVIQAMQLKNSNELVKLNSEKMYSVLAYVKSISNGEKIFIDIDANEHMKKSYTLGEKMYMTPRGKRGLSCNSCHHQSMEGQILRTQALPSLSKNNVGGSWPAYRMTTSQLETPQKRFQGCMKNSLQATIPIGSREMIALEVYIAKLAEVENQVINIPGLKR